MFEQIKSQLSASGFSILTSLIDQNNYAHGKHANKLSILSPNEVNITGKIFGLALILQSPKT